MSLERHGLGASCGLVLLGVPGDGSRRPSLLGEPGENPDLWCCWTRVGLGGTGGLCIPEGSKKRERVVAFLSHVNFNQRHHHWIKGGIFFLM